MTREIQELSAEIPRAPQLYPFVAQSAIGNPNDPNFASTEVTYIIELPLVV